MAEFNGIFYHQVDAVVTHRITPIFVSDIPYHVHITYEKMVVIGQVGNTDVSSSEMFRPPNFLARTNRLAVSGRIGHS